MCGHLRLCKVPCHWWGLKWRTGTKPGPCPGRSEDGRGMGTGKHTEAYMCANSLSGALYKGPPGSWALHHQVAIPRMKDPSGFMWTDWRTTAALGLGFWRTEFEVSFEIHVLWFNSLITGHLPWVPFGSCCIWWHFNECLSAQGH